MDTLRELGTFLGLPDGDPEDLAGGASPPYVGQRIRMRQLGALLGPASEETVRTSLRAMIRRVSSLSVPVGLQVELLSPSAGLEPFSPVVRIQASSALILSTRIHVYKPASLVELWRSENYGDAGGDRSTELPAGTFDLAVRRVGVEPTGLRKLVGKTFRVNVTAASQPPVEPTPVDPPPPAPQLFIEVEPMANGGFKVKGSGFLPRSTVYLAVGDELLATADLYLTDTSDKDGRLVGLETGNICRPGQKRFFVANDGRVHAGRQVTSNTVEKTCPF